MTDNDLTDELPALTDPERDLAAMDEFGAATHVLDEDQRVELASIPSVAKLLAERDALARALSTAELEREDFATQLTAREAELAAVQDTAVSAAASLAERTRELEALRADLAAAQRDLGSRGATIARRAEAAERDASKAAEVTRDLRDSRRLATRYLERLRAREWRRGVVETDARELEATVSKLEAQVAAPAAVPSAVAVAAGAVRDDLAVQRELEALRRERDQQAERIAELEAFGVGLGRAMQAQSDAAYKATERLEEVERNEAAQRARVHQLEEDVAAARRRIEEITRSARANDAELAERNNQLAEALREQQRLERLWREQAELAARTVVELEALRAAHEELSQLQERAAANSDRAPTAVIPAPVPAPDPAQPVNGGMLLPLDGTPPVSIAFGRRTTIGRAPDADIQIRHASVSRRHAVIIAGPNGTFIEDQKSANGVGVNSRRVRTAQLNDGDLVAVGSVRFRFAAAPTPAPTR